MTDDTRKFVHTRRDDLAAFAARLDAYGSDPARWPEVHRGEFSSLLARSADARQHLAEAKALDAVLSRSARLDAPRRLAHLEDLVVAAAVAERGATHAGASSNVVPMRSAPAPVDVPSAAPAVRAVRSPAGPGRERTGWRAAALLAASLCAGIMIGISEPAQTTVSDMMAAVETSGNWEESDIAAAIQADPLDGLEEQL